MTLGTAPGTQLLNKKQQLQHFLDSVAALIVDESLI